MLYAQVVLPLAQPMYTFSLEEGMAVEVGDAVVVQFGSFRYYTGIVWSISEAKPDLKRIKPILRKLYSTPLVSPELQQLWEWVADYYMCSVGEVMRVALPSLAKPKADSLAEFDERTIEAPAESYIALKEELRSEEALLAYHESHRRAPRRIETMDRIAALAIERKAEDGFVPRRLVDAETVHITDLRRRGLVVEERRLVDAVSSANDFLLPILSEAQSRALDAIHAAHADDKVALLHGVTGSGKTEIYIHLIAETLAQGRDVPRDCHHLATYRAPRTHLRGSHHHLPFTPYAAAPRPDLSAPCLIVGWRVGRWRALIYLPATQKSRIGRCRRGARHGL